MSPGAAAAVLLVVKARDAVPVESWPGASDSLSVR